MGGHSERHGEKAGRDKGLFSQLNKLRRANVSFSVEHVSNDTYCGRLAISKKFEVVTLSVIVVNALMIGVDTEYNARFRAPGDGPEDVPLPLRVAEYLFCTYFTMEILVRLFGRERKMTLMRDAWFCFDFFLVSLMLTEAFVLPHMGSSAPMGQLSVLRLLRLLRVTRVARIMKAFPELMMIIKGILAATRTVACTVILMAMVIFVWSILFVSQYHQGDAQDDEFGECYIEYYFGSLGKAFFTLFVTGTLLDDIQPLMQVIMAQGDPWMLISMILFILIASFNVLNTLVGVLVEVVCATSEGEKLKAKDARVRETIRAIFDQMDEDHSGLISHTDFIHMKDHKTVMKALRELHINERHFDIFGELLFRTNAGDDTEGPDAGPVEARELSFDKLLTMITMLQPGCPASALDFSVFRGKIAGQLSTVKGRLRDIEVDISSRPVSLARVAPPGALQPLELVEHEVATSTPWPSLQPLELVEREAAPLVPWSSECGGLMPPWSETTEMALSEALTLVGREALEQFVDALGVLKTTARGEAGARAVALLLQTFAQLERVPFARVAGEMHRRHSPEDFDRCSTRPSSSSSASLSQTCFEQPGAVVSANAFAAKCGDATSWSSMPLSEESNSAAELLVQLRSADRPPPAAAAFVSAATGVGSRSTTSTSDEGVPYGTAAERGLPPERPPSPVRPSRALEATGVVPNEQNKVRL